MTTPEPQYAPGDPVLVAAVVARVTDDATVVSTHYPLDDGPPSETYVRASDVHPMPPTPDARDTAIAAVRAIPDDDSFSHYPEASAWVDGYNTALERVRAALDGVVPVPAPPAPTPARARALAYLAGTLAGVHDQLVSMVTPADAAALREEEIAAPTPTPTGWTAERVDNLTRAVHPEHGMYWWGDDDSDEDLRRVVKNARHRADAAAAALALRAEEAAAAAPATTDDNRVEVVARRLRTRVDQAAVEGRSHIKVTTADIDAILARHRAAGSPS